MKKLSFLVLLLFLSAGLFSKEIHVSVNGNDKNEGSSENPFRTISQASREAMPGDIIIVHSGVYREQIVPPRGGNSETERIVYQAARGENVEIKGSEIVKNWEKGQNDTWSVKIPNSFFGGFNPYTDLIRGDWFTPTPKDRKYHTGAVYLNGDWLMEASSLEEVMRPADESNQLWFAIADSTTTTIRAQFKNADPNRETVEINVRQTIFYPDKPFINFITVSGFKMQHASTNWAPPTAEQMGLIGTHWSRGWIIENNVIQYSKCVGISLGKYGDEFDNKDTESAIGYVGTINRALAFGWNKGTIGGHIVRNNTIAFCEQAGIVGSMGCAFSIIQGNTIHDIHVRRLFTGAEMAGIKFHGAIDVQISNNHIYKTVLGVWLDWMAQGAQVKNNLMHDNSRDIFLEVNHGPMLVSNNILLSKENLLMNSSGAAFVHNIFGGNITVIYYDSRLTPLHKPHSTFVENLHDNPGGDVQFVNNLFVNEGNASQYGRAILPVIFDCNVFTKGTVRPIPGEQKDRFGEMSEAAREEYGKKKQPDAVERNSLIKPDFNGAAKIINEKGEYFMDLVLDKNWLKEQTREIVSSTSLSKALVPDLKFENPDGSELIIDKDYFGELRDKTNPSPGPFEIKASGNQRFRVWGKIDF